jgi:type IV secretion system protein VirB6
MTPCPALSAQGPSGIAVALRSIDCQTQQGVELAFARLFGSSGALSQALTALLTIYIALLALSLLTGRTQLRLNMLTPRMLQVGLVLTFATSWTAFQTFGWNLLTGAPDEIASALLGTKGSATQLFAQRLDVLFDVIAQSAHLAQTANATATVGTVPAVANLSPKPADLLWLSSLMLLLGTVGVLIVARIALATVMGLGPVFIVMALFPGTRGLFEGWLKAAVMLALTPLIAVVIGGGSMAMAAPMIRSLAQSGGAVSLGLATNVFVAAFVYLSLMGLALRAAALIVGGWRLGRSGSPTDAANANASTQTLTVPMLNSTPLAADGVERSAITAPVDDRVRDVVRSVGSSPMADNATPAMIDSRRTNIVTANIAEAPASPVTSGNDPRVRSLGQGFRTPQRVMA